MTTRWMGISNMRGRGPGCWLAASLILLALTGCGRSYTFHGTLYDPPRTAPALAGVNWDDSAFQLADHQGKVAVIFFGYSYCPDVCPLTLAHLAQVYAELGEKATDLAVVFVSTDPERDTPARLAEYVPAFRPEFFGLHIPADQLEPIKKAYGVYAEAQGSGPAYAVAHNEYLFVVDKSGALRLLLPANTPPEDLRADLEHLLQS